MATINTELKEYHFYGKDMVEGVYYRKADVDKLIESLKAGHNVELPGPPKPRRATWLEVARWCATGNGLVYDTVRDKIDTGIMFKPFEGDEPIMDSIKVRKWPDTDWHEPTVDYMGIDDKDYNFNKKYGEV